MSTRNGKRSRVLSSDERALWMAVIQSIAPLRRLQKSEAEKSETTKSQTTQKHEHASKTGAGSRKAVKLLTDTPPPLAPLERQMKRRVARGRQTIDARLDLHGLTQAEAHAALLRFLRTASARGARLVLVVTGKGSKDLDQYGGSERGVLRRQVPQWLASPNFRNLVIGFEDAHIVHGGEGALYVRVRRSR
jgi:DNA-nicking Smr family endonuclease